MSKLTRWISANTNNNGDFVADQRAWVVLVIDVAALALMLGLLILQGLLRTDPYSLATLIPLYFIAVGAAVSLLLLRFVGYRPAAHAAIAAGMLSVWFINIQYASEFIVKTETVYLVVVSVLPALLLGRVWMIVYGVGTLIVVAYIASVLGRGGNVAPGTVHDYLVDTSVAVVFVIFVTYFISDIYGRALDRVRRLLDRQQHQTADLVRMTELLAQSEVQARQFYRNTIYSVTDGKLSICDVSEVKPIIATAQVEMDVRDAASVSLVRREVKAYLERHGLTGERLDNFIVAVGEAITNVVKHAGGGCVYAGMTEDAVWVAITDRGPGIESLTLPKAVLLRGFSTKPSMGLGYSVILESADRVLLKTDETGTTVVLFKRINPAPPDMGVGNLPDTWR